jgi:glycosyltransferase involved in cell wall biosynthesis
MQIETLSVVLPAHNEEATAGSVLEEVFTVLKELQIEAEVIVVNDGSTDRTGGIVRERAAVVPMLHIVEHHPGRGYGGALKAGFERAGGDWIAFFPTDGQFVFAELAQLLRKTEEADIISGYRAERRDNVMRRLNALGWNLVVRLLFGPLCRDIDCGFKLFRREILERVRLVSDGAMVDTELLAGAVSRGYRIVDVPVTHLPRRSGEATGAHLGVIARAFADLVRFRRRLSREVRGERACR